MSQSELNTTAGHETGEQAADTGANFGSIASFADAEAREILNLLNLNETGAAPEGGCCGGSCCS